MNRITEKAKPASDERIPTGPDNPVIEECRGLLYRIHWPENRGFRAMGLVAAGQGHGVTLLVQQMGWAATSFPGRRVVLLDAHWDQPALTRNNLAAGKTGLTDFFFGDAALTDTLHPTRGDSLMVMPVGSLVAPLHSVDSSRWGALLDQLREMFDLVIVDLPSLQGTHSQLGLSAQLDGILFVLHGTKTLESDVRDAKRVLGDCGANLIGAIWNEGTRKGH